MSQVATQKKLALRDHRVKLAATFRTQGSVLQGTKVGACERLEIEVSIESDEAADEIDELIRLSHRMCYTEAALSERVPLTKRHVLNGQPLP
jgi:organic hydroperoxide reductase OsmC/OhrA